MERVLYKLEDLVYDQLDAIVKKKDISPTELESAEKAVCLLLKINELLDGEMPIESEGYSNRRMRHSYGYRDGMYITPAHDRMHLDHSYTYTDDRYSRHSIKDRAIDRLERMMDDTKSESEKETVRKMIVGLEHMELY